MLKMPRCLRFSLMIKESFNKVRTDVSTAVLYLSRRRCLKTASSPMRGTPVETVRGVWHERSDPWAMPARSGQRDERLPT